MGGLTPLFSHGLVALAVVALLTLMAWAGQHGRPRPGPGTVLFRYNPLLRWFAYLVACGIPAGLALVVYFHPPRGEQRWIVFGLYVLFAGLTWPLVWEVSRLYLLFSPDGIETRSPWRGT